MNATRRFIVIFLILIISLSTSGAAQSDVQYFPDTGHYLRGSFLQYYYATQFPKLVYGSPLTEQITARDGKIVQYFHNSRFELTPDNRVQLTPLGRLLYNAQSPLPVNNTNGCEKYPTGYSVCFTFLDFYKANGGQNQFGNPISPFEYTNGLIVQYFEGARFEWHANLGAGNWVVISDLGRLYFDQQKEDPAHLRPALPPDATIKPVISLKARAFVLKAVTLNNGAQSIYVVAQDQLSQALSDANVTAVIHLTDGKTLEYSFNTNAAGIGQKSFDFNNQKPGELITIDITVSFQGYSSATTTSFRIWF
jgi:hypothetical protein